MTDKYTPKPGHVVQHTAGDDKVYTIRHVNYEGSVILVNDEGGHTCWYFKYLPRHAHRYNAYYDDPAAPDYQFGSPQHLAGR